MYITAASVLTTFYTSENVPDAKGAQQTFICAHQKLYECKCLVNMQNT